MKIRNKDVVRTVKRERKRFISLAVITMLGVVMLTGLKAACVDLRSSADTFFDEQKLHDLSIQSSTGSTQEDVDALMQVDGVKECVGTFSETVYTMAKDKKQTAELKALNDKGIDEPYVTQGTLPEKADEIAVSSNFMSATGKQIGDVVTIEEDYADESTHFPNTEYRITAVVTDPTDVNSAEGAVSFRSTATTDYVFYVTEDAVESDLFTAAFIQVDGAEEMLCYFDEYMSLVDEVKSRIENSCKEEREQERDRQLLELIPEQMRDFAEVPETVQLIVVSDDGRVGNYIFL